MKLILTTLFALTLLALAQETPAPAEDAKKKKQQPQFFIELEALTKEERINYFKHFQEANRLFQQKRIFECLNEIHALSQIYELNPASLNLKGACYVEFRAFDKAHLAFTQALKITPDNFNVRFNLSEIDFVTKNYTKALEQLKQLLKEIENNEGFVNMVPIIKFKVLLCMLKTNDTAGAEKILEGTDFLDDSPLFYYGNAALEYFADRGAEAEVWLARAGRIFRDPGAISPWQDTLIESGYIKSFYGGDLEVNNISPSGSNGE